MLSTILLAIFALLLGAAFCFVGYRFFLVMLPIWGFFAGFWIGAQAIALLLGGGFLANTTGLIVGLVVGIIGAVLSYLFYTVGVLVIAGAFGAAVASGIMSALGIDSGLIIGIVAIISGLIAAGLALLLNLQKYVIIILTAIGGAALIALSGMLIFGQVTIAELQAGANIIQPILEGSWFWGLVWLALAIVGIILQIRTNRTYAFTSETYVENWG
jgi:hypothetical protein